MWLESEISEIIQGNVRNLIRGKKDIKTEKFSTLHKIYLENQWKSNNKFVWNKNSLLVVEELAKVLLQSKKNQICLGLTPAWCVLVRSQVIIYILLI